MKISPVVIALSVCLNTFSGSVSATDSAMVIPDLPNTPRVAKGLPGEEGVVSMGVGSESSSTNNLASKGNFITVNRPLSLESIAVYLEDVPAGTTIEWAVYESPTFDGTFTKVWETSRTVTESNGYFSSGPVMVDLQPGTYYWLGGYWDQEVTYGFSNSQPGAPLTFPVGASSMTYHARNGAYSTLPGPGTFEGDIQSTGAPYWQRYVFSGSQTSIFYDTMETGNTDAWSLTVP